MADEIKKENPELLKKEEEEVKKEQKEEERIEVPACNKPPGFNIPHSKVINGKKWIFRCVNEDKVPYWKQKNWENATVGDVGNPHGQRNKFATQVEQIVMKIPEEEYLKHKAELKNINERRYKAFVQGEKDDMNKMARDEFGAEKASRGDGIVLGDTFNKDTK